MRAVVSRTSDVIGTSRTGYRVATRPYEPVRDAQWASSGRTPEDSSRSPSPTRTAPPRYKLALINWVGAYGVITLILALLGPAMAAWPLPLRTLLLSAVMAPAMTWAVVPLLTRLFRSWLVPGAPPPARPPWRR